VTYPLPIIIQYPQSRKRISKVGPCNEFGRTGSRTLSVGLQFFLEDDHGRPSGCLETQGRLFPSEVNIEVSSALQRSFTSYSNRNSGDHPYRCNPAACETARGLCSSSGFPIHETRHTLLYDNVYDHSSVRLKPSDLPITILIFTQERNHPPQHPRDNNQRPSRLVLPPTAHRPVPHLARLLCLFTVCLWIEHRRL
jgi:hypothetical protein